MIDQQDPREVVEVYRPPNPSEVVEVYTRPLPECMAPKAPSPAQKLKKRRRRGILIFLALVLAALGCKLPSPVSGVITTMGRAGSPLSFVALGVALNFAGLRKNRRILTFVVLARMLLIPAVFLSAAIAMGFRGTELIALSVLFASPTAAASFTVAQQMGGDGELAAQIVALTSILSIATIFGMICLFQALALL